MEPTVVIEVKADSAERVDYYQVRFQGSQPSSLVIIHAEYATAINTFLAIAIKEGYLSLDQSFEIHFNDWNSETSMPLQFDAHWSIGVNVGGGTGGFFAELHGNSGVWGTKSTLGWVIDDVYWTARSRGLVPSSFFKVVFTA